MLRLHDTIAALATAPGAAGLAVVRVSGPEAIAIGDAVFRGATRLAGAASHTLHHGWVVWPSGAGDAHGTSARRPGDRLDETVVGLFRTPRSYTREDVAEFSCHGGVESARAVLAALLAAGARAARPGEFTLRAFLAGRIDLAQAEAVADLIQSGSERSHAMALSQLAGGLSRTLGTITESLRDAAAEVEARVDFAEDVGGVEVPPHVVATMRGARESLEGLLEGAAYGRAVREGARVPIVGRPNVGKSSLFNALVGESRAIVTDVPGTTRDRVSEAIELDGIRVTLSDTAGVRATDDPVEALGIARTEEAIEGAAVVLWVIDATEAFEGVDAFAPGLANRSVLVALNKTDLPQRTEVAVVRAALPGACHRVVDVSARRGAGVEQLKAELAALLGGGRAAAGDGVVTNARHVEALDRARAAIARAVEEAASGAPGEIVAMELRESLTAIGEVTGATANEDLLERIFGRFCIGK